MLNRVSRQAAPPLPLDLCDTADFILTCQDQDGAIPWWPGGPLDPWDHVESAMGLAAAGRLDEAARAYLWLAGQQGPGGGWWHEYHDGRPIAGAHLDANMSAYLAVGLWHFHLAGGGQGLLEELWPCLSGAMDFVLGLQREDGAVAWARRADGSVDATALLTGCSSIFLSLGCALQTAELLGRPASAWREARGRLGRALAEKPQAFDNSKSRYAMDWYYPALAGALDPEAARARLAEGWERFCLPGWGVRCVADKPWVTMAETAELVLALGATGQERQAAVVFSWLSDKRYPDGAYWMGCTCPDREIYTRQKTSWTAGAVLLAADCLMGFSPAARLFRG